MLRFCRACGSLHFIEMTCECCKSENRFFKPHLCQYCDKKLFLRVKVALATCTACKGEHVMQIRREKKNAETA